MKKLLLIVVMFLGTHCCHAQIKYEAFKPKKHSIQLQAFSDLSLASIVCERLLYQDQNLFFTSKIGLGWGTEFCIFSCELEDPEFVTIPFGLTANFGANGHFFETGLGGTLLTNELRQVSIHPSVGYRGYLGVNKNFLLRIHTYLPLTPLINEWEWVPFFLPAGVALGYAF